MGQIVGLDGKPLDGKDYSSVRTLAHRGYGGFAGGGGIHDQQTGLGGDADHSEGAYFEPTVINDASMLDTIYVESWAARRFVDMPIDDMFVRGREFESDSDDQKQKMIDALDKFEAYDKMARAMKCGRLYGTGFVVFMTDESDMSKELLPENYSASQLKAMHVFNRFDATIEQWYINPRHQKYGSPSIYKFIPQIQISGNIDSGLTDASLDDEIYVHESRVLRFDGIPALSSNGWQDSAYDRDWGVSELIAAIVEILHDATFASAIAHLAQEASIPVIKVQSLKEAMSGAQTQSPDEPSITELGEILNMTKSIYKTMFLDVNDEFERVPVTFQGLAQILDMFGQRLASMAGVPATRFLSRSPTGMNATGESDMKNYSIHVGAMQQKRLRVPMQIADTVITQSESISESLESVWLPLADLSELEQAEIEKIRSDIVLTAAAGGVIDENEARSVLSRFEFIGELPEWDEAKLKEMRPTEPEFDDDFGSEGGNSNSNSNSNSSGDD